MTNKKRVRERKRENKARRYYRWKRMTIQQYFDSGEFAKALSKYFEDVINGLRTMIETISNIDWVALVKAIKEYEGEKIITEMDESYDN